MANSEKARTKAFGVFDGTIMVLVPITPELESAMEVIEVATASYLTEYDAADK